MRHEDKQYLAFVRTLPCSHCGKGAEPHHIIGIKMGVMGSKASDIHTMPLCTLCHADVHKSPKDWPQIRWMIETQNKAIEAGEL